MLSMEHLTPGPPKAQPKAPTICYICGRQYGSKSISIHEPKCLEKWHIENNKLPKSKRRNPPKRPVVIMEADGKTIDIEATNEANWQNAQALLVTCEFCGRRFGEDRIEVHQRSCTAENPCKTVGGKPRPTRSLSTKRRKESERDPSPSPPLKPRNRVIPTVVCYICGRQFGSKSISIHEPKCMEKWHIENNKLPKSKQRSPPERPKVILEDDGKTVDVEATNEANWKNAQALMVDCEHCGRRFAEDRLEVHQRSCTAENPAKRVSRAKSQPNKRES